MAWQGSQSFEVERQNKKKYSALPPPPARQPGATQAMIGFSRGGNQKAPQSAHLWLFWVSSVTLQKNQY